MSSVSEGQSEISTSTHFLLRNVRRRTSTRTTSPDGRRLTAQEGRSSGKASVPGILMELMRPRKHPGFSLYSSAMTQRGAWAFQAATDGDQSIAVAGVI